MSAMDHQNVVYYQTSAVAPRSQSGGQGSTVSYITNQGSTAEFHPTTSAGFTTNASTFHGGETTTAAFITNNVRSNLLGLEPRFLQHNAFFALSGTWTATSRDHQSAWWRHDATAAENCRCRSSRDHS